MTHQKSTIAYTVKCDIDRVHKSVACFVRAVMLPLVAAHQSTAVKETTKYQLNVEQV
jgi:hypothetical protein